MSYTNLEMLRKVAIAINSDYVDTLDESTESLDILSIMETTLDDILSRRHWEFMKDKVSACDAGEHEAELLLPTGLLHIDQLEYKVGDEYICLKYIPADEYLALTAKDGDDVTEVTIGGSTLYVKNNKRPQFYTSFDEIGVLVDSYDITVDTLGIDATKARIRGVIKPTRDFTSTSDAIIQNIPELMFNYWLHETTAQASNDLRHLPNSRAERLAKRAYNRMLQMPEVSQDDDDIPMTYGRRR